jgi:hypothetical protein
MFFEAPDLAKVVAEFLFREGMTQLANLELKSCHKHYSNYRGEFVFLPPTGSFSVMCHYRQLEIAFLAMCAFSF